MSKPIPDSSCNAAIMNRRTMMISAMGAMIAAPALAASRLPRLEAFHPDYWKLVSKDAEARILATGGDLGTVPAGLPDYGASLESPLWHPDGFLLFSDIPQDRILKWSEDGGVETFLSPSGHANGLWLDPKNRLLMAEHSGRQVSRLEPDGSRTVLMKSYRGKQLNRPNTVIVRSDGGIYFTDFGFRPGTTEDWEVDHEGVFYISPDLGTRHLLTRDVISPHKLLFSMDERTLLVGQYRGILAFDMADISAIDPRENQRGGRINPESRRWFWKAGEDARTPRVLKDMLSRNARIVDGMKMDAEGNIWFSGREGVWTLSADGHLLGRMDFGESVPNIAFGGSDMRTLFITGNHTLFSINLTVDGLPIPSMPG